MNEKTEFLQSEEWLAFQEACGKEALRLSSDDFSVNGIIHELPLVGKYLYTPRWPMGDIRNGIRTLLYEAKKRKVRWIRIEPKTEALLEEIKKSVSYNVVKAPHDMQPRENFVIDITKTEEELLAAMKSKTRYNIRLAEKHDVKVFATREEKYREAFLALIESTAQRQHILPHPRSYYEKYFSVFPETMCELWVAEYEGPASTREDGSSTRGGKILAANIVLFYGTTATYLHGGTSDEHRDVMAPVLLQWSQIREAKKRGYSAYDFGGVCKGDRGQKMNDKGKPKAEEKKSFITHHSSLISRSWAGITRFKTGFSPGTDPTIYPGSYDIILDAKKYWLYDRLRHLQAGLALLKKFIR